MLLLKVVGTLLKYEFNELAHTIQKLMLCFFNKSVNLINLHEFDFFMKPNTFLFQCLPIKLVKGKDIFRTFDRLSVETVTLSKYVC